MSSKIIKIEKIIIHPSFVATKKGYDIALIRLAEDVNWNRFIKPICVSNNPSTLFTGETATVAGWGAKEPNSKKPSAILQKVDLPILSNDVCQYWFNDRVTIINSVLCAGLEQGGKDACQGDSGGPLMVKDSTGRYILAGITSYGIGCARPKLPGVYTRTSYYIDWIKDTITSEPDKNYYNKLFYRNYMPHFFFRGY